MHRDLIIVPVDPDRLEKVLELFQVPRGADERPALRRIARPPHAQTHTFIVRVLRLRHRVMFAVHPAGIAAKEIESQIPQRPQEVERPGEHRHPARHPEPLPLIERIEELA